MRDHDQGAGPAVEEVLEDVQGLDVEVVGRLVEQQHVRLVEQQPQQLEPAPLATGQVADPGGQLVAGEAEPLQHRGRRDLAVGGPGDPPDRLDRRQHPRLGSRSSTCWVRCCSATVRPCCTLPGRGRQLAGEQVEHRGLAGAVDADDADPVARAEPPGGVVEQRPLAADQVDVLDVDHVLAEPLGREPLQLEPVARRRHVLDQRVRGLDPELRLRGAGRRAAAQPGQLLADQVLPADLGGRGLPLALGLGQHVRRVAALVGVDDPVVDLPRRTGRPRRGTTGRG